MVLFFTTTLIISIVGIVLLLALKQWELSTGHVLGGSLRPAVGAAAHRVLSWFEYVLPGLFKQKVKEMYRTLRVITHRVIALVVILTERGLERLLGTIKHNTQIRRTDSEASPFLREVSEHKKALIKQAKKRAIYDE